MRRFLYHTVSMLLLLAPGLLACPATRPRGETPRLSLTIAGEIRPMSGGAPLFASAEAGRVLEEIASFFQKRDITAADFAGVLQNGCQSLPGGERFLWEEEGTAFLAAAGIRVLNLADDHSLDCGPSGLLYTHDTLLAQGFYLVGAGRNEAEASAAVNIEQNGVNVSFVSVLWQPPAGAPGCPECPGPFFYNRQRLNQVLKSVKKRSTHQIVMFHFPDRELPLLRPEELAAVREAVDFGADLIIGYGPASAGGLQRVRGRWLIGSMGRLTGDASPAGEKIADGFLLSAEVSEHELHNLRLTPLALRQGKPVILRGAEGESALRRLLQNSSSEVVENVTLIGDLLYLNLKR